MQCKRPPRKDLERLYIQQRLATRVIGDRYNVKHITVRRWLIHYGIAARPTGRGCANRGLTMPSRNELFRRVHKQHQSYREIAAVYGVTEQAVLQWLTRLSIDKPTVWETRYKGKPPVRPTLEELDLLYSSGLSTTMIAKRFNCDHGAITSLARKLGYKLRPSGWSGNRIKCDDGHEVRSLYEQRVCDWLSTRGLEHQYEPVLPFDRRWRADFLVGSVYIEIWGVTLASYRERRERKRALYKSNGLTLLELDPGHFDRRRKVWINRLTKTLLTPSSNRQRNLFDRSQ